MAKGKTPPPNDTPDYGPEPPARERLGKDDLRVDEFRPDRNRNLSGVSVAVTVIVVLVLAVGYFLLRGG